MLKEAATAMLLRKAQRCLVFVKKVVLLNLDTLLLGLRLSARAHVLTLVYVNVYTSARTYLTFFLSSF